MRSVIMAALLVSAMSLSACAPSQDAAPPPPLPLGTPQDLSGFEGARAGQAELGIQSLGYSLSRSEGLTSYWRNAQDARCARIVTAHGRYANVTMVPLEQC